jgi:hypothetical protein
MNNPPPPPPTAAAAKENKRKRHVRFAQTKMDESIFYKVNVIMVEDLRLDTDRDSDRPRREAFAQSSCITFAISWTAKKSPHMQYDQRTGRPTILPSRWERRRLVQGW